MNPLSRQLAIREFELFVSNGVLEIPGAVFEQEPRAAGEYRMIRAQQEEAVAPVQNFASISLGKARIDLRTGKSVRD